MTKTYTKVTLKKRKRSPITQTSYTDIKVRKRTPDHGASKVHQDKKDKPRPTKHDLINKESSHD